METKTPLSIILHILLFLMLTFRKNRIITFLKHLQNSNPKLLFYIHIAAMVYEIFIYFYLFLLLCFFDIKPYDTFLPSIIALTFLRSVHATLRYCYIPLR